MCYSPLTDYSSIVKCVYVITHAILLDGAPANIGASGEALVDDDEGAVAAWRGDHGAADHALDLGELHQRRGVGAAARLDESVGDAHAAQVVGGLVYQLLRVR